MKRFMPALLIVLILTFSFSVCYAEGEDVSPSPSPSVESTSAPTPEASAAPSESPAPEATATPTPAPTEKPVITKNPVSETVAAGGSCKFTVKASGFTWISWYFVGKDGSTITYASKAASVFSGLSVTGETSTVLSLSNIPASMNGLRVGCVMGNDAGKSSADTCYLIVTGSDPVKETPAPTATTAPVSTGTAAQTQTATANAQATASGYNVGTMTNGDLSYSLNNYSDTAYPLATPTPTVVPTPAPTTAPVTQAASAASTASVSQADHTVAILVAAVAMVAIICGTIITLTVMKINNEKRKTMSRSRKYDEDYDDDDEYTEVKPTAKQNKSNR